MSASDAILVGGDWISEHYLTTDATSQSFKAEVLGRRKEWDAAESGSVRSRFTAGRADFLARLAALEEAPDLAADLRRDFDQVLGYAAIGLSHDSTGPLTLVTQHSLPDVAGLALVAANPVDSAEDLLDKDADTLAEPWAPEDGDTVTSVARLLSELFVEEGGPAFALVLAGRIAMVAERERWAEGRYLAIDLQLVCERNDTTRAGEVDRTLACLSAESLAPDAEGNIWWRRVLEESVKHTVGVSQDLREGVRLSIEIIANEVVTRRRARGLEPLPQGEAQPLAKQALRYLYRILFLLYAEASPELGVLPVGATEYEQGYSLDRLRELVQVPLTTPRSETGTHLYDSLGVLFRLVDQGYQPEKADEDGLVDPLEFRSLRADLFRPQAVAHVDDVGLGNARLQQVLQHLLLSKESKGRDRGFISYAELGINQLGAVYEGLMSYTGRFAETDLYEVAKNGDSSKGSWLVPVEQAGGIDDKDFVKTEDPITEEHKPVLHHEGNFVFRLAGRERQQSASYYTPEVLTRFTVGQALEELLDQDGQRTTAEEILGLTVCEPALGSGAFAIEAVRQLAAEYLKRRQEELGKRIDPDAYSRELQRVKAYLALHNVYGVDLNATAVELAEVSLWLDTMVEGLQAPWFGLHLRRGNSLIGARKAVFTRQEVADKSWLKAVPRKVVPGSTSMDEATSIRGNIPHFLLPAGGWGAAADVGKEIKDLVPDAVKYLKTWRRSTTTKPSKKQVDRLVEMGERVERLWEIASKRLEIANQQTRRKISLWGQPEVDQAEPLGEAVVETLTTGRHVTREEIETSLADGDGAYRRLRLVMDAWCALWFWPLTEDPDGRGVAPPTLDQWYEALVAILGGTGSAKTNRQGDDTFADITTWDDLGAAEELDRDFAGAARVDRVLSDHPWLEVCQRVASQQGFFHWELDFAQVFDCGGFDLQVGNPPWVRPDWDEAATFAELDPALALADGLPRVEWDRRAQKVLEQKGAGSYYVDTAAPVAANREFLTSGPLRPVLAGLRPDLYRCFIDQCWNIMSSTGIAGLIHLESHFTDEAAGRLRSHAYRRLRRHWEFANELHLFEIQNQKHYGVNIYGPPRDSPQFMSAISLYHPDTVTGSLGHDGSGPEPGLKDPDGAWDVRPHLRRIIAVDNDTISAWHQVLEGPDVPLLESRMVFAVNASVASVVEKLASAPRMSEQRVRFSGGWVEGSDNRKGIFDVRWWTPDDWRDVILQGPHLNVALPFSKFPNATMKSQRDWATVDLETLDPETIPTCAFEPRGDRSRYDSSYTHWEGDPARAVFRVAWRSMADNVGVRTLFPALIPPGAAHVHGINSLAPRQEDSALLLAVISGTLSSIVADFAVRMAPKSAISPRTIDRLPFVSRDVWSMIAWRSLRLNCLTDAYAPIWEAAWKQGIKPDEWAGGLGHRSRLPLELAGPIWTIDIPLRRDSDRRQALVEMDALVGLGVGLSADELCSIYRTQFPVLYGYDRNTYYYDANGRLVPNSVLTVWRRKGDEVNLEERTATNPSGSTYTYELPFVTLDREADMRQAYAHFEKVLAERGGT